MYYKTRKQFDSGDIWSSIDPETVKKRINMIANRIDEVRCKLASQIEASISSNQNQT